MNDDPVVDKFRLLKAELRANGLTPDLLARARAATARMLAEEDAQPSVPSERS